MAQAESFQIVLGWEVPTKSKRPQDFQKRANGNCEHSSIKGKEKPNRTSVLDKLVLFYFSVTYTDTVFIVQQLICLQP